MHHQENPQVVMETTLAHGPLLRWTGVSFQPPCIPVWHPRGYSSDFIKGPDEGQRRNPRQLLELYDRFPSTHLMAQLEINSGGNGGINQDFLASSSKNLW